VSGVAGAGAAFNPLHVHYDPYASSAQATPSYKGRSYYDKSVGMYEKSQTFQQKQQFGRQQQQLKSVGKVSRTNPLHKDDTFRDLARASGVGAVGLTYFNPLHVHYDPYALNARPSAPTSRAREIYQKSVGVFDKQGGFAALNAGVAVGTVGRGVTMAPGVAMDRLSQSRRDAVEGMRNIATGTIPSNTQLDAIIQKTIKGLDEEIVASKLRPHSKRAVADARELLLDLRQFIHEKNEDEKFQRFFTASRTQAQAVAAGGKSMSQESRPVLMEHLQSTVPAIRSVVTALVMSADFRAIIMDFLFLLKDAGSSVVQKNKPSMEELRPQPSTVPRPMRDVMRVTKENVGKFVKGATSDIRHGRVEVDEELQRDFQVRLRSLLTRISNNEEYEVAIKGLFAIWDELKGDLDQIGSSAKTAQRDPMWQESIDSGKAIIATFTGQEALDSFLNNLWSLMRDMRHDQLTVSFFHDARVFLLDSIKRPAMLQEEDGKHRLNDIGNRGRDILRRWNHDQRFNHLLNEAQNLLSHIVKDPSLTRLGKSGGRLARDFFVDDEGRANVYVTKEIVEEMKDILLPVVIEHLKALPIPRLEGHTPKLDYMVDGIMLQGYDIVPEHVEVKMKTGMMLNTKKLERNTYDNTGKVTFTLQNISSHMRDVHLYYRKKTFPKLADEGLVDIDMMGPGTYLRVKCSWRTGAANHYSCVWEECSVT